MQLYLCFYASRGFTNPQRPVLTNLGWPRQKMDQNSLKPVERFKLDWNRKNKDIQLSWDFLSTMYIKIYHKKTVNYATVSNSRNISLHPTNVLKDLRLHPILVPQLLSFKRCLLFCFLGVCLNTENNNWYTILDTKDVHLVFSVCTMKLINNFC